MENFFTNSREIQFNEIVFANKNKQYGAYVLRSEEGATLKKAMLIGVALFAAVAAAPLLLNTFKTHNPKINVDYTPYNIDPVSDHPEIVKPVTPSAIPPKKVEKTTSLEPPTPTAHPAVETPMPKQSDIADARIGTETRAGADASNTYQIPAASTAPPAIAPSPAPTPARDPNEIIKDVEVEANFSGGINMFREKVVQNFDTSDFEGTGDMLSTSVSFVVEKDGSITGIKAYGNDADFNKQAEKTIKSIKGKWIPAKVKGEAVRSYFKFPISMKFE